ncbi:MAG: RnfABCDGE type electron transport complex subunit G [Gammaproteobacteria bacterium]
MNFSRISLILPLLLFILSGFLIAHYFYNDTRLPISQIQTKQQHSLIKKLMPLEYDNDLINDKIELASLGDLGSANPVPVYRARNKNLPQGIVIFPLAPNGYNGLIQLAISLDYAGTILEIKVLGHNETPGFGDAIDQNVSDWLKRFVGSSHAYTDEDKILNVDHISGATISSNAVIKAVEKCLAFYNREKEKIWAMPVPDQSVTKP